ncbi:MAG TPA: LysR family transcriptional regulator [Pirellulales bacterium]|nr:LysR family transcriptional regulator [Pirellulales bacterium]
MRKSADWTCGLRVWLENDGHVVLGRGRVALLAAIEEQRSIRQAAMSLEMSYRRAWLLVRSMNEAAGRPLVEASKGGNARGGAIVTPFGKEAIRRFNKLDRALQATAARVVRHF